ncbi:ferritin-like domain-containing protein [Embleya scabrispora]|uniref:ferritin-like domain-containing protein n=1 Tax=Embleya scabrispora TaxID=159449 RepID=UPI0003A6C74B|nr:ferritin-like domain-containing protein [Embleya scabrispora]MYS79601.1 hypothetical protein [Streptomyces sp. SID5474]
MKGDPKVMAALQAQLRTELTTVDQFSQHAFRHEHQGRTVLAQAIEAAALRSTAAGKVLSFRLLDLEGNPDAQGRDKITIGENVREMLESDLRLEYTVRDQLNTAIDTATGVRDWGSQRIFLDIFTDRETHLLLLERQLAQLGT